VKSFVSILFVSCLVWNYIGFFAYFQLEKQAAQKSFKSKLKLAVSKDDLRTFHFSQQESSLLIWHKVNEFEYQGGMFDIVYSDTITSGECIYTCISDAQETALFKMLGEYVAQDLNTNKHKPLNKLKVNLEQPFICDELNYRISHKCELEELEKNKGYYFFSIQTGNLSLNYPPPQILSV
jgi:hypothetical protein